MGINHADKAQVMWGVLKKLGTLDKCTEIAVNKKVSLYIYVKV